MANSSLPYLTAKSVPALTDLTYIAKDDFSSWYTDSKASVSTLKSFCSTSLIVAKTANYPIPIAECDGRWFSTKGAAVPIAFTLPQTVEEAEVGFVLEENITWTEIIPFSTDKILPISSVDGESVYGMNYGCTIRLRGVRDGWHVVSSYGTWNITGSSSSSSCSSSSLSSSSNSCSSSSSNSNSCSSSSSNSNSCSCSSSYCSSSCSSWYSSSCSCSSSCSSWYSSSSLSSISFSSSSSESTSNSSSSSNSSSCSSSSSNSSSCSSSSCSSSSLSCSSSSSYDYTDTMWGGGFIV